MKEEDARERRIDGGSDRVGGRRDLVVDAKGSRVERVGGRRDVDEGHVVEEKEVVEEKRRVLGRKRKRVVVERETRRIVRPLTQAVWFFFLASFAGIGSSREQAPAVD